MEAGVEISVLSPSQKRIPFENFFIFLGKLNLNFYKIRNNFVGTSKIKTSLNVHELVFGHRRCFSYIVITFLSFQIIQTPDLWNSYTLDQIHVNNKDHTPQSGCRNYCSIV